MLDAMVGSLDGTTVIRDALSGPPGDAVALGTALAQKLLALGARRILDAIRTSSHT